MVRKNLFLFSYSFPQDETNRRGLIFVLSACVIGFPGLLTFQRFAIAILIDRSIFALIKPEEISVHRSVLSLSLFRGNRSRSITQLRGWGSRDVLQATHVLARETRGCYEPARISVPKRARHSTACGWRAVGLSPVLPFHRETTYTLKRSSVLSPSRFPRNFDLVTKCIRCSGRPRSPSTKFITLSLCSPLSLFPTLLYSTLFLPTVSPFLLAGDASWRRYVL